MTHYSSHESKLNPRAKLFSPSPLQHRSATPPAVLSSTPEPPPTVSNTPADPEADLSSFAYCSSVPAKFLTRNNLFLGNGWSDLQYVQPVCLPTLVILFNDSLVIIQLHSLIHLNIWKRADGEKIISQYDTGKVI